MTKYGIVGVFLGLVSVFVVAPLSLIALDYDGIGLGLSVASPAVAHHAILEAAFLHPAFSAAVREVLVLHRNFSHGTQVEGKLVVICAA